MEGQLEPTASFWYGLDTQGDVLWEQYFVDTQFKAPGDFVELEDGSIIIVGFDENVPQIPDEENIFIIKEAYGWMAVGDVCVAVESRWSGIGGKTVGGGVAC